MRVPSFLVVSIESAINFAISMYLVDRIVRFLREEEESSVKCIILDMSAMAVIDASGLDALAELNRVLNKRNIKVQQ
ncbi:hypothetical protein E2562_007844 [Oryza meyeriana var. granulata]|uniref:STAS domain-containing protein n=1 Tax=Oryza meyeriana var. granulata TaxID=110450 RepID=A0A6G1F5C5_9ORYZ|nr:hypothetical protein E2562_007844 [Oryza meyeriana var. granulata]